MQDLKMTKITGPENAGPENADKSYCNLALHFHVLHFQALLTGPSFSRSCIFRSCIFSRPKSRGTNNPKSHKAKNGGPDSGFSLLEGSCSLQPPGSHAYVSPCSSIFAAGYGIFSILLIPASLANFKRLRTNLLEG